jgi:hypothetical protein
VLKEKHWASLLQAPQKPARVLPAYQQTNLAVDQQMNLAVEDLKG